ncbi:MAG: hypothetical protein IIU00_08705 [Clostridia bacterium]|nr:hypothetical protein [Clostridia bacterium]
MRRGKSEYLLFFLTGAVCYGLIEILWRGRTHWTMLLTGGLCAALLHRCNRRHHALDWWSRCGLGCLIITAAELAVGWLVNVRLGMGVWDYSDKFGNLCGQICPEYSAYWYFLSMPVFGLSNVMIYFSSSQNKTNAMLIDAIDTIDTIDTGGKLC